MRGEEVGSDMNIICYFANWIKLDQVLPRCHHLLFLASCTSSANFASQLLLQKSHSGMNNTFLYLTNLIKSKVLFSSGEGSDLVKLFFFFWSKWNKQQVHQVKDDFRPSPFFSAASPRLLCCACCAMLHNRSKNCYHQRRFDLYIYIFFPIWPFAKTVRSSRLLKRCQKSYFQEVCDEPKVFCSLQMFLPVEISTRLLYLSWDKYIHFCFHCSM